MSGVGVIPGADLDWGQIDLPCAECGEMVDLNTPITVTIVEHDGSEFSKEMTEANARALLASVGLTPPPVRCERHAALVEEPELEHLLCPSRSRWPGAAPP